jgi:predicted DNA-binding transcriptional regulator AlpA
MARGIPERLLTMSEIAVMLDIRLSTVRAYKARKQMPAPDRQYGQTSLWRESTIQRWRGKRKSAR